MAALMIPIQSAARKINVPVCALWGIYGKRHAVKQVFEFWLTKIIVIAITSECVLEALNCKTVHWTISWPIIGASRPLTGSP